MAAALYQEPSYDQSPCHHPSWARATYIAQVGIAVIGLVVVVVVVVVTVAMMMLVMVVLEIRAWISSFFEWRDDRNKEYASLQWQAAFDCPINDYSNPKFYSLGCWIEPILDNICRPGRCAGSARPLLNRLLRCHLLPTPPSP